jgi:hypothetical protein
VDHPLVVEDPPGVVEDHHRDVIIHPGIDRLKS